MANSKAMLRVLKARENVAQKDRWFADVIYNVRIIEDSSIPTMCTNGVWILFNPDFVLKNDVGTQIEGVFCHESWHVILDHVHRQSGRVTMDWNIACDAIINPMVERRGWELPKPHVRIKEVDDKRMTAEQAYEFIRDKRQEAEQKRNEALKKLLEGLVDASGGLTPEGKAALDKFNDGAFGAGIPMPGSEEMRAPTPEEAKAIEEDRQKLQRAIEAALAKGVGTTSYESDVIRHVRPEAPTRELDWRDIIRDMADKNRNMDTRTWSRPSRRFLGRNILMPGYMRDKVNRIVVCFDISGSIVSEMSKVAEMKSEVAGLLNEDLVTNVVIISADTDVRAFGEVSEPHAVLDFDLRIRNGGTAFASTMAKVKEQEDCVGCVFLTDMQTSSFGSDPGMPVVWINWGHPVHEGSHYWPPFGRVIDFNKRN